MGKIKFVRLADSNLLSMKLKPGAVVHMGDGWRGKVETDDGENVILIRDGAEPMNKQFIGYRGLQRRSVSIGGARVMCRSPVIDMARKSVVRCRGMVVVDRARLESEWEIAPALF